VSYISVEGLIGAGKSTLSKALAEDLGWMLLPEPVEENPVLPLFYEDPKRWGFAMQIQMLHWRWRQQQVAGHSHVTCIIDRSLPGDRVFAKLQTKYGNMHEMEWSIYESCYRSMSSTRPPFLMIYLEVDPEIALARIYERARNVEVGIKIDYLIDLDDEYEELIRAIESGNHQWSRGIKVLRVPWNDHAVDPRKALSYDHIVSEARRYVGKP
jgi:deoxyadenosine/deoxycytidine kinase